MVPGAEGIALSAAAEREADDQPRCEGVADQGMHRANIGEETEPEPEPLR